jgi:topoisomerase-4 subunit A
MATSIPSHNVAEVIDATLLLIDNPHAEHAELMQHFRGPDFATGGLVVDSADAVARVVYLIAQAGAAAT